VTLPQNLKIYPNPVNSFLNIEFELDYPSDVDIRLFNLLGQAVLVKNTTSVEAINEQLQIGHLPKGIYILSVVIDGQQLTKKILIE
jgi:hypothetical protein